MKTAKILYAFPAKTGGQYQPERKYENYHLQLQFKWGALSWGQKKGKKKDSGLLYHSVGKYGADYGAWMRSQEFQIEEGEIAAITGAWQVANRIYQ